MFEINVLFFFILIAAHFSRDSFEDDHIITSYFANFAANHDYTVEEHKPLTKGFSYANEEYQEDEPIFMEAMKHRYAPVHCRGYQQDTNAEIIEKVHMKTDTNVFTRISGSTHIVFGSALVVFEVFVFGLITCAYLKYDAKKKDRETQLPFHVRFWTMCKIQKKTVIFESRLVYFIMEKGFKLGGI